MAGGRDFVLQRKTSAYYSYTTGAEEDGNLRHWRREETVFEIEATQKGGFTGSGDLGQKSGVLVYSESGGDVLITEQTAARVFICEADGCERADEASGFYFRQQTWRKIGQDKEYNPETGEDI